MGVTVLRRVDDGASVMRFTLHSHHLAKLDRFAAQARRHATPTGGKFSAVTIEIDAAGAVSVHAAGLQPLVLCPTIGG